MSDATFHRLGIVLPAANTTLEVELPRWFGEDTSWHFHRFEQMIRSADDLAAGAAAIAAAAAALVPARIAAVGVGYTAGSFVGGLDWDARLRDEVTAACGAPAATAASAIVAALRRFGVESVAAVSPYSPAVNERLNDYLTSAGYTVRRVVGEPPPGRAGEVPIEEVERMAVDLDASDADLVLISCTGLRTMSLIDELESRIGKPVVSSNQTLAWALLMESGTTAAGPGALFAR